MDSKKLKKNLIISALMVVIISTSISRMTGAYQIRLVEFLSILAMGMAIGVTIVNLALYIKSRKNSNK